MKEFSTSTNYYDGTKILSMLDLNNQKPALYLITTNRSAGKTTYFNRMLFKKFLKKKEKFCLFFRFDYEAQGASDNFFKDIHKLFFPEWYMITVPQFKGALQFLYCSKDPNMTTKNAATKGQHCGYAVALNKADTIKRYSHLLSDTQAILFDEFQSETNHYCPDELRKFQSVYTSIARGNGEVARYVPVYMLSNNVSLINPYYSSLGISKRLKNDTRYLKGEGFVLETGILSSSKEAQAGSAFNKAFKSSDYTKYLREGVYLNDNIAFIQTPKGAYDEYLCNIRYENKLYAIKTYSTPDFFVLCTDKVDPDYHPCFAVSVDDHNTSTILAGFNKMLAYRLNTYFQTGRFRFTSLEAKNAILDLLSY